MQLLLCAFSISFDVQAAECDAKKAEDFAGFFASFSNDKQFAMTRTVYPLSVLRWKLDIDAQGRDVSSTIRTQARRSDADEVYNQLGKYMKDNGLQSKIKSESAGAVEVTVFKPDTDWLLTYKFKQQGRCWFFYEFENHSL